MLKVLLDALPAAGLAGAAVVITVTTAAPAQASAAEGHLRELLGELGAVVVTPGLAAVEAELARPRELAAGYAGELGPHLAVGAASRDRQGAGFGAGRDVSR